MSNGFPRVLVVSGYTFNQSSGGSITMSNLFRGWPKDRLAIVDADGGELDTDICVNRHRLVGPTGRSENPPPKGKLKHRLAKRLGLAGGVFPVKYSKALLDYVKAYKPEVIYTQASQLSYMWLAKKLLKLSGARLVYHVMDDFPKTTYTRGSFSIVPRMLLKKEMSELVRGAAGLMGISDGMCSEYKIRFSRDFHTFHNPVESEDWSPLAVLDRGLANLKGVERRLAITYSGRIGLGARTSIIGLINAVQILNESGVDVCLNLYTGIPIQDEEVSKCADMHKDCVNVLEGPRSVEQLKAALQSSDLLVLPVDFDTESINFLKLSMPTKLPAYMMSGVPILVYGPSGVHSVDFVMKAGVGRVCTSKSPQDLAKVIKMHFGAKSDDVALVARRYAEVNFIGSKVRDDFRQVMLDASLSKVLV